MEANAEKLDAAIDYKRDLGYDYFGFKTLEKSYLLRVHGKIVERAACGIHWGDLEAALETYDMVSALVPGHRPELLSRRGSSPVQRAASASGQGAK